jgi:hypothetical protein
MCQLNVEKENGWQAGKITPDRNGGVQNLAHVSQSALVNIAEPNLSIGPRSRHDVQLMWLSQLSNPLSFPPLLGR